MTCEAWPILWPSTTPAGATEPEKDAAAAAARFLLWARTGRRLGLCTVSETYVPATSCCIPDMYAYVHGFACASCCGIWLAQQPVASIDAVTVDGLLLDVSAYQLDGARLLSVGGCWGSTAPCPQVTIEYTWGVPITAESALYGLVQLAMGEVAVELLQPGDACRLPSRLTSIARQGVTRTFDPNTDEGLLGLPVADQLILSVNPGKKRSRSRVYAAQGMPRRVR